MFIHIAVIALLFLAIVQLPKSMPVPEVIWSRYSKDTVYDGVVLKTCLDHKFQWPQESLNCESLTY